MEFARLGGGRSAIVPAALQEEPAAGRCRAPANRMAPHRQSAQRSMISISGSGGLMLGADSTVENSLRDGTVFDAQAERQLCLNSSGGGGKEAS